MDFGASTSRFKARLCHLILYLFGIECCSNKILATATHSTLLWAPIFHQQEDKDNGFTFFNAGVFAESSLRKQAWRNPKEGRVGWLHSWLHQSDWYRIYLRLLQQLFTSRVPCVPVFDVPASPSHTSPRPILDVLKSLVSISRPQVPSPHTPVSLSPSHFYTHPVNYIVGPLRECIHQVLSIIWLWNFRWLDRLLPSAI